MLNHTGDSAAFGVHLHVSEYDKQSTCWCHKSQLIYAGGPFVSAKIYKWVPQQTNDCTCILCVHSQMLTFRWLCILGVHLMVSYRIIQLTIFVGCILAGAKLSGDCVLWVSTYWIQSTQATVYHWCPFCVDALRHSKQFFSHVRVFSCIHGLISCNTASWLSSIHLQVQGHADNCVSHLSSYWRYNI